jgi:hypothetical protein
MIQIGGKKKKKHSKTRPIPNEPQNRGNDKNTTQKDPQNRALQNPARQKKKKLRKKHERCEVSHSYILYIIYYIYNI